jgi:hypothetical protein
MKEEVPRLSFERLRRAVTLVCVVAIVGFGMEVGLNQIALDPALILRDRSNDFLVPTAAGAASDSGQSAINQVLRKPLFIQGRGIEPSRTAATVMPTPPTSDPAIRLLGVQLSSEARLAFIQLSDSDHTLRAIEGQSIGSWILAQILRDHIELTRKSETRSIYLGDTRAPADDEAASP